jgi:hypothetical protein
MNTDVEDLLREGMERFTADLRAPAGLTRRAARRRRRLALCSAAGAAALTAGAVPLAAAGIPGASHNDTGAAAYVVKRAVSALNAAEPGQIAQMTVTTTVSAAVPGGQTVTTTAEEWSYDGQWRSVTNSPAGHPVYDEGYSTSSGLTLVSYQARTWARQPGLGRPATVATALRAAVSCGTLAVAGRPRVDGIEAIELTSRPGSLISETVWVSPGTYLPVRVVIRSAPGQPVSQQAADITWLPLSAQNLARLTVPIPAGFRQVPLAQAVTPISPRTPAWNMLATPARGFSCPTITRRNPGDLC